MRAFVNPAVDVAAVPAADQSARAFHASLPGPNITVGIPAAAMNAASAQ